jgi:isopenicillin N synthase-like dioxygenase
MDLVPVVDISDPASTSMTELDRACRDHGFFLLSGHGLDRLLADTFDAARRFFDASRDVKGSVRRSADNPLGYNERELTKRVRDHKEVFDFVDPIQGRSSRYNRWPEGVPGFREAMSRHYDACSDLAVKTTGLVFSALGLPHQSAARLGDRTTSSARLNHYTLGDPVPEEERVGLAELADVALGHHTDLGLLTLLIQDDVGGLQARSLDHGWIDVEPRPGTIVVNLADCMQVLTNNRYRAALHRVLPMTTTTRLSIPYFYNPLRDSTIEPIPELAGGVPDYRGFTFRDYVDARSADNFADAGAADAQIADYAI